MSLADYLANKYLTADRASEKKSKKRKRKGGVSDAGLVIADDDLAGWSKPDGNPNEDEDSPLVVGNTQTAQFRKSKTSGWKTVSGATLSNDEQAAADAVLASAAAERAAEQAAQLEEDAPQVVYDKNGDEDEDMEDAGTLTGLQSAAQVAKSMKKKAERERRQFEAMGEAASGKGQETIYRDASGRTFNLAKKRAEEQQKAQEEEAKKRLTEEAAKGDVQRALKERNRKQLEDAKYMTVARYADDTELNTELKDADRWNDPAAGFIKTKKAGRSVTGKPLYKGAAPPNRYGIRPGYRWDGVDRSNGFEKEYFAAHNKRKNMKDLQYAWEMDE